MSSFQIRPFRRGDRDQLIRLVNGHVAAVMPGASLSVNAVLQQLEREPGEFIVDPWVAERVALVAEQGGAIVAATLLLRYRNDPDVGPMYRNAGEVRWLLFWPMAPADNPFWHDGHDAADALIRACLAQFDTWRVTRRHADGNLPYPGVYGVPAQWPHVEKLYERHGFADVGPVEIVMLAELDRIDEPSDPPVPGLAVRRLVGVNGTRLTAHVEREPVAYIEVEVLDHAERHARAGALADIGNFHVGEEHRRRGVGGWLLQHAAHWLRLGRVDRLISYGSPDELDMIRFLEAHHFRELTRTRRGWTQQRDVTAGAPVG